MLFHILTLVVVLGNANFKNLTGLNELNDVYINLPYKIDFKLMVSHKAVK